MRKKTLITLLVFVLLIVGIFAVRFSHVTSVLLQTLFNRSITLQHDDGHINLLLLGTGGGDHEGPNLSDTIIFLSLDETKNTATMVSLPRDMWAPELDQKINTAYAIGEGKRAGGGLVLAKSVVSTIINQPINYGVRIDFAGFVKAVDMVGGLDIDVERTFDDYQYPIEESRADLCGNTLEEATARIATEEAQIVFPCRYEHVHFDQGATHMDGKRALIFVRSRYATGSEGTDFARSKRQAKVIAAFREKLLSAQTLLNPSKIMCLYDILSASIDTDIKQDEFDDFIKLAQKMQNATIKSYVIDYGDKQTKRAGFLVNPPISSAQNNEWVLIPRIGDGKYTEIQAFVACVLSSDASKCSIK